MIREAGYKVPEEVSIMGFDDIEFASIAYPPLTTIRQALHEMGATAAELLLRKLTNDDCVQSLRVGPELIVRSSTCAPQVACLRGAQRPKFKSAR
jgi:DNA-binding LacI/PurR family transcriptional regulator